MKKEEYTLPEGITEAMIASAMEHHKIGRDRLRLLELPLSDDPADGCKTVLAKVPERTVIGQFQRFIDSDPKKAQEILVKACLLSHKDEVLADDGLFFAALTGISELIPVRKATVKNL